MGVFYDLFNLFKLDVDDYFYNYFYQTFALSCSFSYYN